MLTESRITQESVTVNDYPTVYRQIANILNNLDYDPAQKEQLIQQIPGYLGAGTNGYGVRVVYNGQEVVAKVPRSFNDSSSQYVRQEVERLKRLQGIPYVVEFLGFDDETGVIFTRELKGKQLYGIPQAQYPEFSDAQIAQFLRTALEIFKRGFTLDTKHSNFIWDEANGVIQILDVLDQHTLSNLFSLFYNIPHLLANTQEPYTEKSDSEAARRSADANVRTLKMTVRILKLLHQEFPEQFRELAEQNRSGTNFFRAQYRFVGFPAESTLEWYTANGIAIEEELLEVKAELMKLEFL